MSSAFVLLNCDIGSEPEIIYELTTGYVSVTTIDGHACITDAVNFDLITIPDV